MPVNSTSRVLRLNFNHLRSPDLLALRQESRATSQRFPSLKHVLCTVETIWEHTIILIQTEDWVCRQEEVVGAIVVVPGTPAQPPRTDKRNPPYQTARMPAFETTDHSVRQKLKPASLIEST